jgi:hypothetical protein
MRSAPEDYQRLESQFQSDMTIINRRIELLTSVRSGGLSARTICLFIAIFLFGSSLIYLGYEYIRENIGSVTNLKPQIKAQTAARNFTYNLCDDAFKTEDHHYAKRNPPSLEVRLKPGCFSGFVELPVAWRGWRSQFVGPFEGDEWGAAWWKNDPHPTKIFTPNEIASDPSSPQRTTKEVRLQGKGKMLFYRVQDDGTPTDESEANAPKTNVAPKTESGNSASPAPKVAPIPPPVGPAIETMTGSMRFGFYPCIRVADAVQCRGYIRSEYPKQQQYRLSMPMTFLSDDAGRRYPASDMRFAGKTCVYCAEQVFPQTTTAFSVTFPGVPAEITKATLLFWHTPNGKDDYARVDLPIDAK